MLLAATYSVSTPIPDTYRQRSDQREQLILGLPQRVWYQVFKASVAACQRSSSSLGFRHDELAGDESDDFIHVETGVRRTWRVRFTVSTRYENKKPTVSANVTGGEFQVVVGAASPTTS